ncbi:MAG: phosphopentomutase, partial [Clostridia bacterium]|nr:phosphopentomutase [Clostridia bacterium]
GDDDLLIITADHGCDPAFKGTDHTREYIPILCWKKGMDGLSSIGTRETYADLAATICDYLGAEAHFAAHSFANDLEG